MSGEPESGAKISDSVTLFEMFNCPAFVYARKAVIDNDAREKRGSFATRRKVFGPGIAVVDPVNRSCLGRGSNKEEYYEERNQRR